ncbi:hypothetical protein DICVIV_01973 [Dictyocaulus viviparus]|uniref:Uncharacterized protein n=1 Tax=Dictyocaulus viviparus TaxID=29172 RepID=A0A0D8Y7E6_DICVI|nr:hypothetical protein DICVIV_01973 [Dictyocaulus viviparus]
MNFFKRKFSFTDEEGDTSLDDPANNGPPSAFSFQALANKVTSTISYRI